MAAALRALPGNPSSAHAAGRAARAAIEDARADVAALVGASAEEIVFTSGGTEANELAIRGLIRGRISLSPPGGSVDKRVGVRSARTWSPRRLEHPSVPARSPPRTPRSRTWPSMPTAASPRRLSARCCARIRSLVTLALGEPRARQRLRHRGAGARRARGGRAVPYRRRAGGGEDRRRRGRAGRRCADAVGAQASRPEGRRRGHPAPWCAVRAARRRRAPGARASRPERRTCAASSASASRRASGRAPN